MNCKAITRSVAVLLTVLMIVSIVPLSAFASIPNWADNNVVYDGDTFGTNGYYNVISKKDYVLVPGAAVESEIVLNNQAGNRRQVIHVIEVDPSNPDVSIVPGYNQIDKDLTDEANWSHKELTDMAKYYEDTLGYNIVGGMNTDLYYDTYAPRVLVYNGQDLSVKGKTSPSSSILYVFQDAEGNISCDVKAFNRTEFNQYLADGVLLHAVGVSFGMVVKDGELVSKTEERTSAPAARSMVGVKADGTLVICMNDGRGANNSVGFCNYEEGEAMLALGCQWAANCDGGGSSTFLTKRVGEDDFTMRSVPCDGAQRPTAHGIFVASNVAPTGILDTVNVTAGYDIFAPNTAYTFGAEAIDTHGYAMDMPADAVWALSDTSFGIIEDGKFISNGKKGIVDVQVVVDGNVVGAKSIVVADPEVFKLSATSTVMPYSTADKVRTITLPIVAMTGEANVYVDTNAVNVTLSNGVAGELDGFKFTATTNTEIAGVNVTITYGDITLTYAIEFGKGSEVIFDFEDGDRAGFMGFEEAKKWSQDYGVNNTLVGSDPLAGQFNEYLSSKTFISSTTFGGEVRNGNYALAWRLDNTDASFANWSYNVLFNTGDVIVLRDVANGKKATTLGMWLYIPENAFPSAGKGLAFQSQLYVKNADGSYSCKQDHFMFTSAATGKQTNLNSATNADIPESRWVYASIDISKYDYLCTSVATDEGNSRSPSFIRTYVKPETADEVTFYIDDITLDYSSAVDDRVLPVISAPTYSTSDTAIALENGAAINGNKIAFSATVTDNAALDLTSGKIFVDGIEIAATINGSMLSSKEDVALDQGAHTVMFEVKDELGNPARLYRTFDVTSGDFVIGLTNYNDSGETPKAQSIYYIGIKAEDLSAVKSLTAVLKLNTANTWETVGAIVAEGFKATFDYNEISKLLTVEIEAVGGAAAEAGTIVYIPVRVWTYDRYNYVTEEYLPVSQLGNKPVVDIEVDVVYGSAILNDKSAHSFSGSIVVDTELTTISSPYHVHDAQLVTLPDVAPTCGESGYTGRTYCETCQSVVDWGTIREPLGHAYELVGNQFICSVCDEVYYSGTGIFAMNGALYYSINGELKTGWQTADRGYCYAGSDYKLYIGEKKTIGGITYVFNDRGETAGAWVKTAEGTRYSYGPGFYARAWVEIDGKDYYFGTNTYMYTGIRFIKANPDTDPVWFDFGVDGGTDKDLHPADGLYEVNGDLYYCKDGITQFGFWCVDGDYYYFEMGVGFERVGYAIKNRSQYVSETNGMTWPNNEPITIGTYNFGADGKMVFEHGPHKNGHFYINGVQVKAYQLVEFEGDFYYVSDFHKYVVNKSVYLTNADLRVTGLPLYAGYYSFDGEGKMIYTIPEPKNGPESD
ncbi:MAG: phosphodiester glycosidase family protein, partial [Clostridia bacterium]|nr:phosphodiester glycosidase family protein [Clostridia bacterium]